MLVGGIAVAVVLAALAAVQMTRRRTHDDVHSVEGYHRKLHTLEEITVHPVVPSERTEFPESALRVGRTRTVRLTDGSLPPPPPVPPPLVADPDKPVLFDDNRPGMVQGVGIDSRTANDGFAGSGLSGRPDRAMSAMNRRPRRLAGPALAVAAVVVLIVVLLLAGIHKTPTKGSHHGHATATATTTKSHRTTKPPGHGHRTAPTTTTTAATLVSAPQSATTHSATYTVGASSYSVVFSATGLCWLSATDTATGAVLYTGELSSGEAKTVQAQGPVTVEVGAPQVFGATVNGQAVTMPFGFQAPFTMHFVTPA